MTSPWGEHSYETEEHFADESAFAESPYGESYEQTALSEWESPFGEMEREDEAESPFGSTESEIMLPPENFAAACGSNPTADGKPWKFGTKTNKPGVASDLTVFKRAEVYEFQLSSFDVDRHELKPEHRARITAFAKDIIVGIRENRYDGPVRVFTYGEASSTGSTAHNGPLSMNRAFNVLHAIHCEFKNANITHPILYGLYGTTEQHARAEGPDNKEDPNFRGVIARAFVPLKEQPAKPCRCKDPEPTTTAICVSVPRIAPRNVRKLPPDVIPLGAIVPGLRLPFAIVTKAQATVQVEDRRSRQRGTYNFNGWGLEVALPAGRARVDLQADLRASIEVLVRASAHLGAKLQLGPLKLTLKVDLSVFAELIVKLCAQLKLRLDIDLGRPNLPELRQCRYLDARNVRGPFPFAALNGPAGLIVPGAGYGPAILTLGGPAVSGLGLPSNVIHVPADKSTIRTLLALGGSLQLAQGGALREAEAFDTEWPEAFEPQQAEFAPFA